MVVLSVLSRKLARYTRGLRITIFFAIFLQNVNAIEKLHPGFNVLTQNWYESVDNLTALSRDAADDVIWVHTASSTFLQNSMKLSD